MRKLALIVPLFLLSACDRKAEAPASKPSASPPAIASSAPVPIRAPSVAAAPTGGARNTEEETGLYNFSYSYPAQAGAIPALKALLDADADKQRAALIAAGQAGPRSDEGGGLRLSSL